MNRSKRIALLLCVLVLISAATFAMTRYEDHKEKIQVSGQVILEVPAEEVQTLSWNYEDTSLAFHRGENGVWRWDEDDAFPVNETAINDLLNWFSSLSAAFIIEDVEDYSQYGLTKPECVISFTTEKSSYTVSLGAFSQMDSQRYLSIEDGNAYLIASDPMEDFQVTIRDLIQHDQLPQLDDVVDVTFSGKENYTLRYEEDSGKSYSSDDVYYTANQPLDTKRVVSYLGSLEDLELKNYATYNATEEELASFGMTAPELTVTINYRQAQDGDTAADQVFTLHVSRNPDAVKEAQAQAEAGEEAEEAEIPCYLRLGDSPIVYEITESLYNTLTKVSYNDLRHQALYWGSFENITQVDVTLDGSTYTLTTVKESQEEDAGDSQEQEKAAEDGEVLWYYKGQEVNMDDFRSALTNLAAEEFTQEKTAGKEEISLTLHLNHEAFPEVRIQLCRYDGSNCLALVDGVPTAFVKRIYMVDLMEAVNAIVLNSTAE